MNWFSKSVRLNLWVKGRTATGLRSAWLKQQPPSLLAQKSSVKTKRAQISSSRHFNTSKEKLQHRQPSSVFSWGCISPSSSLGHKEDWQSLERNSWQQGITQGNAQMLQTPTLHSKITFFISKHLTVSGLSALEQQSAFEFSSGKCYLFVQAIWSWKMHIQYLLEPMGRGENNHVLNTINYFFPCLQPLSRVIYYTLIHILHSAVSWMVQV